jgi:hypothetical protein
MMNKLNGWQRLSVVVMALWTIWVGVITWQHWPVEPDHWKPPTPPIYLDENGNPLPPGFVPDKPIHYDKNGTPIPEDSKVDNWMPASAVPLQPGQDVTALMNGTQEIRLDPSKFDTWRTIRLRAVRDAVMLWLLPPTALYVTWLAMVWVYRGFRPRVSAAPPPH